MAITLSTLTGNVHDLVGGDFTPRRTKVYVKANVDRIIDTENLVTRLGTATYQRADQAGTNNYGVEDDGSFSFSLIATGSASTNLNDSADLQYTVYVDYGRTSDRSRRVEAFGPYAVTGSADIAELEPAQALEITWQAADDAFLASLLADSGSDAGAALTDAIGGTVNRTGLNARPRPGRPILCITVDDGAANDWAIVKPILDTAGVKATFCLPSSLTAAGLTWAHAATLAANGHELAAHSATHANLGSADAATIATEVTAPLGVIQAQTGVTPAGFCYPYGANNAAVRQEVRNLYSYGLGDTSEGLNTQPLATYNLLRRHIQNDRDSSEYMGWVDEAGASNGLLILLVHAYDFDSDQQGYLADTIAYAQTEWGMDVMTVAEALAEVGNVLDLGDYPKADGLVVGGDGSVGTFGGGFNYGDPNPDVDDLPNTYPEGWTVQFVTASPKGLEYPGATSGVLVTNRAGGGSDYFTKQEWHNSSGAVYKRSGNGSNAWGAWKNVTSVNISTTVNAVAHTDLPNTMAAGVNYYYLNSSGGSAFPGGTSGVLTTINMSAGSDYYIKQTWRNSSNDVYERSGNGSNAWQSWKQTTAVSFASTVNGATFAALPNSYPDGVSKYFINVAGGGSFPGATSGVLTVTKYPSSGSDFYTKQVWENSSNEVWARSGNGSNAWQSFVKLSP